MNFLSTTAEGNDRKCLESILDNLLQKTRLKPAAERVLSRANLPSGSTSLTICFNMNIKLSANVLSNGLLLFSLFIVAGCESTNPYAIKVEDTLDDALLFADPQKYALGYSDKITKELLASFTDKFHTTLEEMGYEYTAQSLDAKLLVYLAIDMNGLVKVTREKTAKEVGIPMVSDSIRYKNVASMVRGGRYTKLLNDNPNDPGELLMGPDGNMIATGNLKERPLPSPGDRPLIEELQRVNQLIVSALELPFPADPKDIIIPWQVKVRSDLPIDKPAPSASDLVEAALERMVAQHP